MVLLDMPNEQKGKIFDDPEVLLSAGLWEPRRDAGRVATAARLLHMQARVPGALHVAHSLLSRTRLTSSVIRSIQRGVHLRVLFGLLEGGNVIATANAYDHLDYRPFYWHPPPPAQ
jgi:hypothetical protein